MVHYVDEVDYILSVIMILVYVHYIKLSFNEARILMK